MVETDFVKMVPILCIFQLLIKIFCHNINNWKLHKIDSFLTKSGLAIQFIKRWSEAESFTIFENYVYSH